MISRNLLGSMQLMRNEQPDAAVHLHSLTTNAALTGAEGVRVEGTVMRIEKGN